MSLTVDPAERALNQARLAIGDEQDRPRRAAPDRHASEQPPGQSAFDAAAPVSIDPDTEAAVADLHAVDIVPLATALRRYGEDV